MQEANIALHCLLMVKCSHGEKVKMVNLVMVIAGIIMVVIVQLE